MLFVLLCYMELEFFDWADTDTRQLAVEQLDCGLLTSLFLFSFVFFCCRCCPTLHTCARRLTTDATCCSPSSWPALYVVSFIRLVSALGSFGLPAVSRVPFNLFITATRDATVGHLAAQHWPWFLDQELDLELDVGRGTVPGFTLCVLLVAIWLLLFMQDTATFSGIEESR